MRLGAVALCLSGCADGAQPVRDALDIDDFAALGGEEVYPAAGAMALRGALDVQVALTEEGEAPEVWLRAGQGPELLDCQPSTLSAALICPVFDAVPEDQDLIIEVDRGGEWVSLPMSARAPEPGQAWLAEAGLELLSLGASDSAAELLAPQITGVPMVMVLGYGVGGRAMRIGVGSQRDEGVRIASPGLVLVSPVDDPTTLEGPPSAAWLPLSVEGETLPMPLRELVLFGEPDGDQLEVLAEGVVPGDALASLAEAAGVPSAALRAVLELDVDQDGDGRPDAATIQLRLQGHSASLEGW
ncbi:MAG: hypothetical protein H6740_26410 [Alphaproteobacteria bacterium]|nr:hypothetical protein [Alphaproteobacteria bacterium]